MVYDVRTGMSIVRPLLISRGRGKENGAVDRTVLLPSLELWLNADLAFLQT
jgi:hypothetical protein